jgi:rhodanese-related sulfurtransferase
MVTMKRGYKEMVDEAYAEVVTLSTVDAIKLANDPNVVFVDVRDVRELEREGLVPNSFHAPRGMLEFWIDPDSPYHKPVFAEDKKFVFFCAAGWRSALAAKLAQDMGMQNVAHIEGGFGAWKQTGGPVSEKSSKPKA